ncbi:MAG: hypothetical protein IJM15_01555, partial [Erysipelotrichaceae bacterium]|nr:hypothetical protein [Erysipelotrichaceae bacterium]
TFKRVEIISPVGPSNKFNNYVHFDVKTVKEEKSEFKPIVDIINTMGPQPEDIANDDVDQKVASLSVDDFTGYKPTHAAFNTAEQLAPPVQQPQPVPEPQPVIEPQPVVIPQTVVEVQPEEPVIVQQDDRQSAYIRDFSDVFHTSSQDVIVEQPPVEEKTQAAPDFSIPEHLAEDERKNRMDTDKYENLSLFDFLEDDK